MPNNNPILNIKDVTLVKENTQKHRMLVFILSVLIIIIYSAAYLVYNSSKTVEQTVQLSDEEVILDAIQANARQDVSMEESLSILEQIDKVNKASSI